MNITFEPPGDARPAVNPGEACEVAKHHGGAGATAAEIAFGLLTWPELGGIERMPAWRAVFDDGCLPQPGPSLDPKAAPSNAPGCGDRPEAVLVDGETGEFIARYTSQDLRSP